MTTVYTPIPQTISKFIPGLNKQQVVSTQTVNNNKQITYRSFKVYSFPNINAKNIRLVDLGYYSPVYKSSSYYEITQEFIINTYSSTQELINNKVQPSFYTWEQTTTHLNYIRQLANTEALKVTWTPPITQEQIQQLETPLTPQQLEQYLQPFSIQVGDVYGVSIPPNCTVLEPINLNPDLLINVDRIVIKPLALEELVFSFRGVEVISYELPIKCITDNPKLTYAKTLLDPPKVPPNVSGIYTDFPSLDETPLNNYSQRRNRTTSIIATPTTT